MIALALHLLAAAVWGGGLVFLGLTAGVAARTIPPRERIAFFRVLGRRFGLAAALSALVLAVTGIHLADERLAGWGDLTGTHDGRLVLAKTILFGVAAVLAAVHALVLGPRIGRLRERLLDDPDDAGASAALRRAAATSGVASLLMLAATVAIFVLAADLGT